MAAPSVPLAVGPSLPLEMHMLMRSVQGHSALASVLIIACCMQKELISTAECAQPC